MKIDHEKKIILEEKDLYNYKVLKILFFSFVNKWIKDYAPVTLSV